MNAQKFESGVHSWIFHRCACDKATWSRRTCWNNECLDEDILLFLVVMWQCDWTSRIATLVSGNVEILTIMIELTFLRLPTLTRSVASSESVASLARSRFCDYFVAIPAKSWSGHCHLKTTISICCIPVRRFEHSNLSRWRFWHNSPSPLSPKSFAAVLRATTLTRTLFITWRPRKIVVMKITMETLALQMLSHLEASSTPLSPSPNRSACSGQQWPDVAHAQETSSCYQSTSTYHN